MIDLVDLLYEQLAEAPKGYDRVELGSVWGNPILLFQPQKLDECRPHVLVTGGFHGDEPGGVFAAMHAMEQSFGKAQVSFLPMVNPTGLRVGHRWNQAGADPNRGYCHHYDGEGLSVEGEILMAHRHRLLELSADAMITLHEMAMIENEFFLHLFGDLERTRPLAKQLVAVGVESGFYPMSGMERHWGVVKNGTLFNSCHGSFEDWLWHQGVPLAVCGETPTMASPEDRIRCGERWIEKVVESATAFSRQCLRSGQEVL